MSDLILADSVKNYLTDLFAHLGLVNYQIDVTEDAQEIVANIQLDEQESGMLIGHHGETITGLQRLVTFSFLPNLGDKKLTVNVNDYRQQREQTVRQMARKIAERVKENGQSFVLPPLPANERLFVHLELKEDEYVETHSEGEGQYRRVVVSIKQPVAE